MPTSQRRRMIAVVVVLGSLPSVWGVRSTLRRTASVQSVGARSSQNGVTPNQLATLRGKGWNLTTQQAETLESGLQTAPDDMELRSQLIAYYHRHQTQTREARTAHQAHVLWLIRHRPDHPLAAQPEAALHRFHDGIAYTEAAELWSRHIESIPNDVAMIGNAARFFASTEFQKAETLFQRAHQLDPTNFEWLERLAHHYFLSNPGRYQRAAIDSSKARLALTSYELALKTAPTSRFFIMDQIAQSALEAGELEKSEHHARALLDAVIEQDLNPAWYFAAAFHRANIILGRVALRRGDVKTAEAHLLKAAAAPTSPQLSSVGPDTDLAGELLDQDRREVVIEYLKRCGTFWKDPKLGEWIKQVEAGETPQWEGRFWYWS